MFPKKTIILVLAGVLYFFNPFDIIPDYILYIGFIDDIAVSTCIMGMCKNEIEEYKKFKDNLKK
jgi:uncharacterized membrane protein YkvA (DUF1232 family)